MKLPVTVSIALSLLGTNGVASVSVRGGKRIGQRSGQSLGSDRGLYSDLDLDFDLDLDLGDSLLKIEEEGGEYGVEVDEEESEEENEEENEHEGPKGYGPRCEEGRWAHEFWRCESDHEFCFLNIGECLENTDKKLTPHVGVCTRKSQNCAHERSHSSHSHHSGEDGVCGCDGRTYHSVCDANSRGVNVAKMGPCGEETEGGRCRYNDGTTRAEGCGSRQFCRTEAGVCERPSGVQRGECYDTGHHCGEEYAPVCGCDHRTYSNICEASSASVNVKHNGECHGKENSIAQNYFNLS